MGQSGWSREQGQKGKQGNVCCVQCPPFFCQMFLDFFFYPCPPFLHCSSPFPISPHNPKKKTSSSLTQPKPNANRSQHQPKSTVAAAIAMGFFKRVAGFLGFHHDDGTTGTRRDEGQGGSDDGHHRGGLKEGPRGMRGGFKATVAVERPKLLPVIVPCENGDGGIQGFNWYRDKLKIDEDGDVADEFLYELPPPQPLEDSTPSDSKDQRSPPQFEVNNRTRKVPVISQARVVDGNVQHCVEHNGNSRWF